MICKHCNKEIEIRKEDPSLTLGLTVYVEIGKRVPLCAKSVETHRHEPAEPAAAPQKRRLMRASPLDEVHEECPDCRGTCSPVEPPAPADSTPHFGNLQLVRCSNGHTSTTPKGALLGANASPYECPACGIGLDASGITHKARSQDLIARIPAVEANSTRPEPLSAECSCGDGGCIICWPENRTKESLIEELKRLRKLAAAPRTQGSELECKHCGQTIRPAKDSKVRGYWIGTNNYLTCPNNVGQPHEPLAAQPRPAPRPACPKCGSELCVIADTDPSDYQCFAPAVTCQNGKCDYKVFPGWEAKNWLELFAASPAPLPLAQAADEVLAELSLLNGKFTQKQNALFDKVRELAASPAQNEEE